MSVPVHVDVGFAAAANSREQLVVVSRAEILGCAKTDSSQSTGVFQLDIESFNGTALFQQDGLNTLLLRPGILGTPERRSQAR